MERNDKLIEDLCIELRYVGCAINASPFDSSLPIRAIEHIGNIKTITKQIQLQQKNNSTQKKISIEERLTILSSETGWNMNKLFDACINFPKKTPKIADIKTLPSKNLTHKNYKEILKFFGDPAECNSAKIYIRGNEIKLLLIDDYEQKYTHKIVLKINEHLENLEKGIDTVLSFIRSGSNDEINKIVNEYFDFCNKFFTTEAKELAFSDTQISKEYFLEKLNVKAVWVCVDNADVNFSYDVLFWEKLLTTGISLTVDENYFITDIELVEIDLKSYTI